MPTARDLHVLEQFYSQVEKTVVEVEQDLAFELHEKLTRRTPVDTGLAASSWLPSVGEPNLTVPSSPSSDSAAAGLAAVASMNEPDLIYVQSNVSYIETLENGHSNQAPNGMVAVSLAELEAFGGR